MKMRSTQEEKITPSRSSSMLCCLFFVMQLMLILPQESFGFQPLTTTTKRRSSNSDNRYSRMNVAIIDPIDIPVILTTTHHAADQIISQQRTLSDLHFTPLSAILTSSFDFFGTPDPLITAGKSIAPSVHSIAEMGLQKSLSTTTIQEMIPSAGEAVQAKAQNAMNNGWKIMEGSKILHGGDASLPGFTETRSLLSPHVFPGPSGESVSTTTDPPYMFRARLNYASTMLDVITKLPYVAFSYALIEFLFLRSNVDIYKEDIEDDPVGVFTESVSDIGVRVGILSVLALITFVLA